MAAKAISNVTVIDSDQIKSSFRVGLIGHGIKLSRTPKMHTAEGLALGLDYSYDLFDTKELSGDIRLSNMLDRAEADGFCGVNITHPFKRTVIPYLHNLSNAAKMVGAVNTVVFRDGERHGHNTDYWGFAEAIRTNMAGIDGERVLLIGAGGAGGAVANALIDMDVGFLVIFDKDSTSSAALVRSISKRVVKGRVATGTNLVEEISLADGIVNATPVGMSSMPGSPVPTKLLRSSHWVCDIIYFPLVTELLAAAKLRGCQILDGSSMAVFQAVRAFELFTGLKPNANRMRATFDAFNH